MARPLGMCVVALLAAAIHSSGCRRRAAPRPVAPVEAPAVDASAPPAGPAEPVAAADELLPGADQAFGLPLPVATTVRHEGAGVKMLHVPASMPRVMRYLERRLVYQNAEIAALGSLLRGARVRDVQGALTLDVGVRDEGDHTLLTVWNRTPPPTPAATDNAPVDSLRAGGIDRSTGQPLPQYNY